MASILKVDKLDPQSGTALEIGSSGDTITVPSGATIVNSGTATGFGATLSGSTNNTVVTVTGANAMIGEAKLLFDPAKLTIGNASEEDTSIVFDGHAQDYYIGLDDTDDDLKIGLGSAVGTTAHMVFDEAGAILKPLTPAFMAIAAGQTNVTGDDTEYTVLFASSERFDQGGNFASPTFTAPVTGKYYLTASVGISGGSSSITYTNMYITTSNYRYDWFSGAGGNFGEGGSFKPSFSIIADMDASDTAVVKISVGGMGSDSLDVTDNSFFGGYLMC
jgi:hypothetical protein